MNINASLYVYVYVCVFFGNPISLQIKFITCLIFSNNSHNAFTYNVFNDQNDNI